MVHHPSPPLLPGSRYAFSSSDLIEALNDSAVSRIVLKAGTYEFLNAMCPDQGGSALCIDRNVTIEAEVAEESCSTPRERDASSMSLLLAGLSWSG